MIAFLIPNEKSTKSLQSYVVSVDSVESLTGIDFFPELPDLIENHLEKIKDVSGWSFNK
jgi:endonuclease G